MYAFPFAFHSSLSEDTIRDYECSDKIYVSMETFEKMHQENEMKSGELMIFDLKPLFDSGLKTAVTIGGFHSEGDKNIVYAPSWILEKAGILDSALEMNKDLCLISLTKIQPSSCSKITIQPFISLLHTYSDPEEALKSGLERYVCIYANSTLDLLMPDKKILKMHVQDCVPNKTDEPLCIRDVELFVNLLAPKDVKVEEKKSEAVCGGAGAGAGVCESNVISHSSSNEFSGYTKHNPRSKFEHKGFVPFGGKGQRLDGKE
jgi:hypothetical protein